MLPEVVVPSTFDSLLRDALDPVLVGVITFLLLVMLIATIPVSVKPVTKIADMIFELFRK